MAAANATPVPRHPDPLASDEFGRHFLFIKPLILERWPAIDVHALDATNGDPEKVVALVAKTADQQDLVRLMLRELAAQAQEGPLSLTGRLQHVVQSLELRSQEITRRAEHRAEQAFTGNLWRNLLIVLVTGLLAGFVLGFTRRP